VDLPRGRGEGRRRRPQTERGESSRRRRAGVVERRGKGWELEETTATSMAEEELHPCALLVFVVLARSRSGAIVMACGGKG
jgi:hypothetical protein